MGAWIETPTYREINVENTLSVAQAEGSEVRSLDLTFRVTGAVKHLVNAVV